MQKTRAFYFFMTRDDEMVFCKALREFNPNIFFLDIKPTPDPDIGRRLVENITDLSSDYFSIVNFDLITKEELSKRYEKHAEYYHFHPIGRAQMQFLLSHPDQYIKGCLQHGRVADSYFPEDEEEKTWKNKVYSILKKLGQKIYWYYTLPEGKREIASKPDSRCVALPDAIKKYDGRHGNFMIHDRAKFVPAGVSLDDLSTM